MLPEDEPFGHSISHPPVQTTVTWLTLHSFLAPLLWPLDILGQL